MRSLRRQLKSFSEIRSKSSSNKPHVKLKTRTLKQTNKTSTNSRSWWQEHAIFTELYDVLLYWLLSLSLSLPFLDSKRIQILCGASSYNGPKSSVSVIKPIVITSQLLRAINWGRGRKKPRSTTRETFAIPHLVTQCHLLKISTATMAIVISVWSYFWGTKEACSEHDYKAIAEWTNYNNSSTLYSLNCQLAASYILTHLSLQWHRCGSTCYSRQGDINGLLLLPWALMNCNNRERGGQENEEEPFLKRSQDHTSMASSKCPNTHLLWICKGLLIAWQLFFPGKWMILGGWKTTMAILRAVLTVTTVLDTQLLYCNVIQCFEIF